MHRSQCINRRFDETLILHSGTLLCRLPIEPVTFAERKPDSVCIPVGSIGSIDAGTHIAKMLGIKKAITLAVVLQTVAPNAMKQVRFAVSSQNSVTLHCIGTICKFIVGQR